MVFILPDFRHKILSWRSFSLRILRALLCLFFFFFFSIFIHIHISFHNETVCFLLTFGRSRTNTLFEYTLFLDFPTSSCRWVNSHLLHYHSVLMEDTLTFRASPKLAMTLLLSFCFLICCWKKPKAHSYPDPRSLYISPATQPHPSEALWNLCFSFLPHLRNLVSPCLKNSCRVFPLVSTLLVTYSLSFVYLRINMCF